jgi:hypothetical protein
VVKKVGKLSKFLAFLGQIHTKKGKITNFCQVARFHQKRKITTFEKVDLRT